MKMTKEERRKRQCVSKKRQREEKRHAGICQNCNEKARPGRIKCLKCQKHATAWVERNKNEKRVVGNCVTCGKPREGASTRFCAKHLKLLRDYRYKRNGSRGLQREEQTSKHIRDVIARVKLEMAGAWNKEVEEFVKANWKLFFDKLDAVLFTAVEYKEQPERDDQ